MMEHYVKDGQSFSMMFMFQARFRFEKAHLIPSSNTSNRKTGDLFTPIGLTCTSVYVGYHCHRKVLCLLHLTRVV